MDIHEDLAEFTQKNTDEIRELISSGTSLIANEWQLRQPQTENEITQFYIETRSLMYDLASVHGKPETSLWQLQKVLESMNGKRIKVLDFGCGIGTFGMLFSKHGFKVTFADFGSEAFEFCKWRCNKQDIEADFIDLLQNELTGKYDVILCVDVLERIPEPSKLLNGLLAHLSSPGGFPVVTTDFGLKEHYPLHLDTPAEETEKVNRLLGKWPGNTFS